MTLVPLKPEKYHLCVSAQPTEQRHARQKRKRHFSQAGTERLYRTRFRFSLIWYPRLSPCAPHCPLSSSLAVPTLERALSSTASSAGESRSSKIHPASPGTGSTPKQIGMVSASLWSTPAASSSRRPIPFQNRLG